MDNVSGLSCLRADKGSGGRGARSGVHADERLVSEERRGSASGPGEERQGSVSELRRVWRGGDSVIDPAVGVGRLLAFGRLPALESCLGSWEGRRQR